MTTEHEAHHPADKEPVDEAEAERARVLKGEPEEVDKADTEAPEMSDAERKATIAAQEANAAESETRCGAVATASCTKELGHKGDHSDGSTTWAS